MSRLRDAFAAGEFVITGEVAPPVGTDLSAMERSIEILGPRCHALNVTDNQGATMHLAALAACHAVVERGFEPIFQQTCRDRNRLALQSDLLAAWALGARSVLLLSGDALSAGDHPEAKPVFDVDSTQLIEMATALNTAHDMKGGELKGGTDFLIGAAVFPESEPWEIQLVRAERKVRAGAAFLQTQAFFDAEKLARCVDALHPLGAKILAGVLLLRNARVIDFINERLPGIRVPDSIADRIRSATDPLAEATSIAADQVRVAREVGADGVHLMPLGVEEAVPRILDGLPA